MRSNHFADDVSPALPWQWREQVPEWWFSKEAGFRLNEMLTLAGEELGVLSVRIQTRQLRQWNAY